MDIRKNGLYILLGILGYLIWVNWQQDFPSKSNHITQKHSEIIHQTEPPITTNTNVPVVIKPSNISSKKISVTTDVLKFEISLNQANIVQAKLLQYPISVKKTDEFVELFNNTNDQSYTANTEWLIVNNNNIQNIPLVYQAPKNNYVLQAGENTLPIELTAKSNDLLYKITYILKRGSYVIDVKYEVQNNSNSSWTGYLNNQLVQQNPIVDESSLFHVGSYTGAAWSNPAGSHYKKVPYSQMDKHDLEEQVVGGWIAMQQHYFLTSWIPNSKTTNTIYTRSEGDEYRIGMISKPLTIAQGAKLTLEKRLYVGPEDVAKLQKVAPGLDLTVDYGWLWFVSTLLFSIMKTIYHLIGNWGWTIILVTVLIKLAFYQLSAKSYRSMSGMKSLQPKLTQLKERFGDDRVKLSQATMELYKQEKINPMGGCLPILVQIPVFIGLYWVLIESIELRQAPFIFWIKDLASPDPLHVLPIIMGLTMFVQQKLNPAPQDPTQAKVMMFLPVMFTGLFWGFPAGLVLYWVVNNTLSILQQWYITKNYNPNQVKNNRKR